MGPLPGSGRSERGVGSDLERHRERDMEPVVTAHPKLLGIGIDPNTIIVVHEDQFEVLGSGKVTITEAGRQQYPISSGSGFDLGKRKPL